MPDMDWYMEYKTLIDIKQHFCSTMSKFYRHRSTYLNQVENVSHTFSPFLSLTNLNLLLALKV